MKRLTEQEIKFVKETGFTPTVFQCDEYSRTNKEPYYIDSYAEAQNIAREDFDIDVDEFLSKNIGMELDDSDSISLEFVATYLLYCFFTKEELEALTPEAALQWLQDYRYFFGFRKWDAQYAMIEINDALMVYEGKAEFYDNTDGNVWWREIEQ